MLQVAAACVRSVLAVWFIDTHGDCGESVQDRLVNSAGNCFCSGSGGGCGLIDFCRLANRFELLVRQGNVAHPAMPGDQKTTAGEELQKAASPRFEKHHTEEDSFVTQ